MSSAQLLAFRQTSLQGTPWEDLFMYIHPPAVFLLCMAGATPPASLPQAHGVHRSKLTGAAGCTDLLKKYQIRNADGLVFWTRA